MEPRGPVTKAEMQNAYALLRTWRHTQPFTKEYVDAAETVALASGDLGIINMTFSVVGKREQKKEPTEKFASDVRHVSHFVEAAPTLVHLLVRRIRELETAQQPV